MDVFESVFGSKACNFIFGSEGCPYVGRFLINVNAFDFLLGQPLGFLHKKEEEDEAKEGGGRKD